MPRFFVGGVDDFERQTFEPVHEGTIEYLRNQVQAIGQGWGDTLSASAQNFVSRASESFDRFFSSEALANSRAAMRRVKGMFNRDVVNFCVTAEDFQQASPKNQRYIMTHPVLRKMFHDQMVDGYEGQYIDHQPGVIGKDHRDWRRLHDGDIFEDEDGDLVTTHYIEMTNEEESEIPLDEKMIHKENQTMLDIVLALSDRDPSNKSGGSR